MVPGMRGSVERRRWIISICIGRAPVGRRGAISTVAAGTELRVNRPSLVDLRLRVPAAGNRDGGRGVGPAQLGIALAGCQCGAKRA